MPALFALDAFPCAMPLPRRRFVFFRQLHCAISPDSSIKPPFPPTSTCSSFTPSHHHHYPHPPTPHHHVLALFSVSCPVHQLSCTRSHDHGPRTNAKNSPNTPPPPSTSTASTPPPRHTSSSTTRSLLRVKPSTRRDRAYLVRDH